MSFFITTEKNKKALSIYLKKNYRKVYTDPLIIDVKMV